MLRRLRVPLNLSAVFFYSHEYSEYSDIEGYEKSLTGRDKAEILS